MYKALKSQKSIENNKCIENFCQTRKKILQRHTLTCLTPIIGGIWGFMCYSLQVNCAPNWFSIIQMTYTRSCLLPRQECLVENEWEKKAFMLWAHIDPIKRYWVVCLDSAHKYLYRFALYSTRFPISMYFDDGSFVWSKLAIVECNKQVSTDGRVTFNIACLEFRLLITKCKRFNL